MTTQQKLYIRLIKRPIGFLGALVALILLLPLFIVTMVLLLIANKNGFKGILTSSKQGGINDKSVRARLAAWFAPVFFTQDRLGKGEKIFKVLKFKTMTDEQDAEGKLLPDADRLTKVGKFIRSTSIDELPQLINILKGDMAFIGPRPLLVQYLPYYTERERMRHSVRPGITGLAQVNGRNHLLWEERFEYDARYAEHINFCLDVRIIIKTVKNVLLRKDVEVAPNLMFFDEYRKQQALGKVFEVIDDAIVDY